MKNSTTREILKTINTISQLIFLILAVYTFMLIAYIDTVAVLDIELMNLPLIIYVVVFFIGSLGLVIPRIVYKIKKWNLEELTLD